MAFQSVPDTAEAVVSFSLNTQPFTNTFYFKHAGGYVLADLQDLANEVDDWVGTSLLPELGADTTYVRTTVRGLENIVDLEVIEATNAGIGGVAVQALPINLAFCVKRETGNTGRSARGRVYLAGFGLTYLAANENFWDSTDMADVITALNALAPSLTSFGWVEVVVSRYSGGAKRATGVTFPVTNYTPVDYRVDSRRDRLPNV